MVGNIISRTCAIDCASLGCVCMCEHQAPQQWWSIRSALQPDWWWNSGKSTMLAHSRAIMGVARSKVCVCLCLLRVHQELQRTRVRDCVSLYNTQLYEYIDSDIVQTHIHTRTHTYTQQRAHTHLGSHPHTYVSKAYCLWGIPINLIFIITYSHASAPTRPPARMHTRM